MQLHVRMRGSHSCNAPNVVADPAGMNTCKHGCPQCKYIHVPCEALLLEHLQLSSAEAI